eukprot:s3303_g7.t1
MDEIKLDFSPLGDGITMTWVETGLTCLGGAGSACSASLSLVQLLFRMASQRPLLAVLLLAALCYFAAPSAFIAPKAAANSQAVQTVEQRSAQGAALGLSAGLLTAEPAFAGGVFWDEILPYSLSISFAIIWESLAILHADSFLRIPNMQIWHHPWLRAVATAGGLPGMSSFGSTLRLVQHFSGDDTGCRDRKGACRTCG